MQSIATCGGKGCHVENAGRTWSADWLQRAAPSFPQVVWISHGLWGLPGGGTRAASLNCTVRFTRDIAVLQALNARRNVDVTWVTNPLIKSHPQITNRYLRAERNCQHQVAVRHSAQLFVVHSVEEGGDFHVGKTEINRVVSYILTRCRLRGVSGGSISDHLSIRPSNHSIYIRPSDLSIADHPTI